MSVAFGAASPVGKFGDNKISDSTNAFAKTGPALNFEGSYKFSRYISFSILISGQQNIVDTKAMVDKLDRAYPGYFFTVRSGDWNIGRITGGISLSVPFGDYQKFNITARVLAGALKTTLPKTVISEAYYVDTLGGIGLAQATKNKVPLNWAFTWLAGIGLRYNLNKSFFLQGNIDYSASSPKAPHYPVGTIFLVGSTYPIGGNAQGSIIPTNTGPHTYKQPINSINICIGTGINF